MMARRSRWFNVFILGNQRRTTGPKYAEPTTIPIGFATCVSFTKKDDRSERRHCNAMWPFSNRVVSLNDARGSHDEMGLAL